LLLLLSVAAATQVWASAPVTGSDMNPAGCPHGEFMQMGSGSCHMTGQGGCHAGGQAIIASGSRLATKDLRAGPAAVVDYRVLDSTPGARATRGLFRPDVPPVPSGPPLNIRYCVYLI